jgi:hypothetical protein
MFLTRPLLSAVGLTCGLVLAGTVAVQGQTARSRTTPTTPARPAAKDAAKPDEKAAEKTADRPRGPFDDPAQQRRMLRAMITGIGGMGFGGRGGGPGGPGGGIGSVGAMTNLLAASEALQDELKLTDEQKARLKQARDDAGQRMRDVFGRGGQRGGQGNAGGQRGGPGGGAQGGNTPGGPGGAGLARGGPAGGPGGGGPGGFGPGGGGPGFGPGGGGFGPGGPGGQGGDRRAEFQQRMQERMEQMRTVAAENEKAVLDILDPEQKKRLAEIELQIAGPVSVAREDVGKRLNLNPIQQQRIQLILEQLQTTLNDLNRARMDQMRNLFRGGGGPGGPGGQAGPGAPGGRPGGGGQAQAKNDAPAAEDEDQRGRGGNFDREALATEMRKAGEDQDKAFKAAEAAIGKVLTARQVQNFRKLQGKPYDLSKLTAGPGGFMGGFMGMAGRGGPGGPQGGRRGNQRQATID